MDQSASVFGGVCLVDFYPSLNVVEIQPPRGVFVICDTGAVENKIELASERYNLRGKKQKS